MRWALLHDQEHTTHATHCASHAAPHTPLIAPHTPYTAPCAPHTTWTCLSSHAHTSLFQLRMAAHPCPSTPASHWCSRAPRRRAYQRAVLVPMSQLEALWRDYEGWENKVDKQLARKVGTGRAGSLTEPGNLNSVDYVGLRCRLPRVNLGSVCTAEGRA